MRRIMVLNDGETYTSLEGCCIVAVPDYMDEEEIELYLKTMRNTGSSWDIDPDIEQTINTMPLVGERIKQQLIDANSMSIVTRFEEI